MNSIKRNELVRLLQDQFPRSTVGFQHLTVDELFCVTRHLGSLGHSLKPSDVIDILYLANVEFPESLFVEQNAAVIAGYELKVRQADTALRVGAAKREADSKWRDEHGKQLAFIRDPANSRQSVGVVRIGSGVEGKLSIDDFLYRSGLKKNQLPSVLTGASYPKPHWIEFEGHEILVWCEKEVNAMKRRRAA